MRPVLAALLLFGCYDGEWWPIAYTLPVGASWEQTDVAMQAAELWNGLGREKLGREVYHFDGFSDEPSIQFDDSRCLKTMNPATVGNRQIAGCGGPGHASLVWPTVPPAARLPALTHELGHGLGLPDNPKGSVMAPFSHPGPVKFNEADVSDFERYAHP